MTRVEKGQTKLSFTFGIVFVIPMYIGLLGYYRKKINRGKDGGSEDMEFPGVL